MYTLVLSFLSASGRWNAWRADSWDETRLALGHGENWLSSSERDGLGLGAKGKRTKIRRTGEVRASTLESSSFAPDFEWVSYNFVGIWSGRKCEEV